MSTITANSGSYLDWASTATWIGSVVPIAGDDAVIPSASAVIIGTGDNPQADLITVESMGTLNLQSESLYAPVVIESGAMFYLESGSNLYATVDVSGTLYFYSSSIYNYDVLTIKSGGSAQFFTSSVYFYNYGRFNVESGGTATLDYSSSNTYNYGVMILDGTATLGNGFSSSGLLYSGGATTCQNTPSTVYSFEVTAGTTTQNASSFAPYCLRITGGKYKITQSSTNYSTDVIAGTLSLDGMSASLSNYGVIVCSGGTFEAVNTASDPGSSLYAVAGHTGATYTNVTEDVALGTIRSEDLPTATDVRSGTIYADSQATGSAVIPGASDVRSGTNVDATTGSAVIPGASDVRSGTNVDATTGSLTVPAVGDVQLGVSVDAGTGTLTVPTEAQVANGVGFGAGATEYTGSLNVARPGGSGIGIGI